MATDVLVVIPARGGSREVPRKNLRTLAGHPLIAYAIRTCLQSRFHPDVVVSSDDEEILAIASKYGARTLRRPDRLARDETTLDEVIADAVDQLTADGGQYQLIVTVQPTSPLLKTETLDAAIGSMLDDPALDTILSAREDTHLAWTRRGGRFVPLYERRVNRQQLEPQYRETGAFIICRTEALRSGSRIGGNVSLHLLHGGEAIDIDTLEDFNLAEWHLSRRHVVFAVAGYPEIGLGHVQNALTIATDLTRHDVSFFVDERSDLAAEVLGRGHYPVHRQVSGDPVADLLALEPDVVINDRLDTAREYVRELKAHGVTVINFEDLGPGAEEADLVVNAIYPERQVLPNHYFGERYFCARNEFLLTPVREPADEVGRVLVTFGGTDPNDLTARVLQEIGPACRERGIEVEVILGTGYPAERPLPHAPGISLFRSVPNMSDHMQRADIVFTSAGRTVFEVACIGTPAIVIAQNERELTHFFASEAHGFVHLGLATELEPGAILASLERLLAQPDARRRAHRLMLENDLRTGKQRVLDLIERTIEGTWDLHR